LIDDQLAAPFEEVGERCLAVRPVEAEPATPGAAMGQRREAIRRELLLFNQMLYACSESSRETATLGFIERSPVYPSCLGPSRRRKCSVPLTMSVDKGRFRQGAKKKFSAGQWPVPYFTNEKGATPRMNDHSK
jgi:hypothetical protein